MEEELIERLQTLIDTEEPISLSQTSYSVTSTTNNVFQLLLFSIV